MNPVLEITNLRVSYGDAEVLAGVDLIIRRGEVVGVVGESGSGKSTLVKAVLGLLPADATRQGRITWEPQGAVVADGDLSALLGSELAYVPQNPATSFAPLRTVGAQVVEPLRLHRRLRRGWREVGARLLAEVGIDDPARRVRQYPHELSGGMRQRALIASALSTDPRLVIADEPTASLDVTTQRRVLDLADRLVADHDASLLLITHDLGIALERCDRIVVLRDGRIVESGTPAELLASPAHPYTRALISEVLDDLRRPAPLVARSPDDGEARGTAAIDVRTATRVFAARGESRADAPGVHSASFRVERGETVAVVGGSGSGKSTLANLILGELALDGGDILINGRSVGPFARNRRVELLRRIQLVHQDAVGSFDPSYSTREVLHEPLRNFGLRARAERDRRAEELVRLVALPIEILDRNARSLSGGQAQRVAIARALAAEPEILIFDESVSALDVLVRRQILDLIADLQSRLGLSSLFITHDLSVVRSIAHRVVVMRDGRVVEQGPTGELFSRPTHPYTQELLAAIPGVALRSADLPPTTPTRTI